MEIDKNNHINYRSKIRVKKDYQQKEFVNPYFNKINLPLKRGFNTKFYLKILAIILIIYLLVYSDLFKIKEIKISGTEMISPSELEQLINKELNQKRFFLLPQRNLIFLSKKKLAQKINSTYSLKKLELHRGWQKLFVKIEEKISYLIIFNKEKFYFVDSSGVVTKEISQEKIEDYWDKFPILNLEQQDFNIGQEVIKAKTIAFILELDEKIKTYNLAAKGYEKLSGGEDIVLVTKEGWRIYFDINNDLEGSLVNLELLLKEKIKNRRNLQYVDLRFGDKIFYK